MVSSISTLTSGVGRCDRGRVDEEFIISEEDDVAVDEEVMGIWFFENEFRILCRKRSLALRDSLVDVVDEDGADGADDEAGGIDEEVVGIDEDEEEVAATSFCLRILDSVGCAKRYLAY